MNFSKFGRKFGAQSGISSLMDDLGQAMSERPDLIMMGGGNPAHIPEIEEALERRLKDIADQPLLMRRLIGIYDPPQGEAAFIESLCQLFSDSLGWTVEPRNIALTNGSQDAFFKLFNLFSGDYESGQSKKILLPLVPEYIGYADVGLSDDIFMAQAPVIEEIGAHRFKYHVDFEALRVDQSIGAICVSRPTNPTGNVLTDAEMDQLNRLAYDAKVPMIIDGAYGMPFPEMIFKEAAPLQNDNTILCLSLSKFGLPAARTGIVVADSEIISALSRMNAIMNLAPGSTGTVLAAELIESQEILRLSREVIKPFYSRQSEIALQALDEHLEGLPYRAHVSEGALFLWLWLPGLPISGHALYETLKQNGVLVVSGHYFFPGAEDCPSWLHQHQQECLRLSFTQSPDKIRNGMRILGETLSSIF